MFPAYKPGDHVLTFNWGYIKAGDVIAFDVGLKHFIKRVERVRSGLYYVYGDNRRESAKMGPIKKEQIVGKVVFRY